MNYIVAIFAGLIQGLTEFLPVSSSGHLVLFHWVFPMNFVDELSFDVMLHMGTLVALLLFFYRDVIRYARAFIASCLERRIGTDPDRKLAWYLIAASIPAGIAGFFFEGTIESVLRSPLVVATSLIVVGILLYVVDTYARHRKTLREVSFRNSLVIGCAQALALIPGVSRSGITIVAGLTQDLNRTDAARFSFLMAIPIIGAAGLKKCIDMVSVGVDSSQVAILAAGFLSAAIIGYLCIKYFLAFLQHYSLKVFAYYRILLGIVIVAIVWWSR